MGDVEAPRGVSLDRVGRFMQAHLKWILLGPIVTFYGTTVHELTHAGAALLSGGTVTELRLLPTVLDRFVFGYTIADGGDDAWMKVAPALLSACLATFAYAWLPELKRGRLAKLCFVLFYLVPLFDVSMAVLGPAFAVHSDLWVLEGHLTALFIAALVFFAAQLWAVPRLFYPLFGPSLSPAELRGLVFLFVASPALRFISGA